MTISEAIASEIQPFSTSDETLEKMFIDATDKFSITASVADEYSVAVKKPVAYAAMRILYKITKYRVGRGGFNRPHNVVNGSYRTKFIKGYG